MSARGRHVHVKRLVGCVVEAICCLRGRCLHDLLSPLFASVTVLLLGRVALLASSALAASGLYLALLRRGVRTTQSFLLCTEGHRDRV